jgi:hypothetical protein
MLEALRRLSWTAERQVKYLDGVPWLGADGTTSVRPGMASVDELALDLDDVLDAALARGSFNERQRTALTALHNYLDQISGAQNAALWTREGLTEAPEWRDVRALATTALQELGESVEPTH